MKSSSIDNHNASVKTFLAQIDKGKTKTDSARIVNLMRQHETLNTRRIATLLNMKESTVTARIDGIRVLGLMRPIGDRELPDGSFVTIWGYVWDSFEWQTVSREYRREKFLRRLKGCLKPEFEEFTPPELRRFIKAQLEALIPTPVL